MIIFTTQEIEALDSLMQGGASSSFTAFVHFRKRQNASAEHDVNYARICFETMRNLIDKKLKP